MGPRRCTLDIDLTISQRVLLSSACVTFRLWSAPSGASGHPMDRRPRSWSSKRRRLLRPSPQRYGTCRRTGACRVGCT
jgi:hypothetical protein